MEDYYNKNKVKSRSWSPVESKLLQTAIATHGKDWKLISENYFKNSRSPQVICKKWHDIYRKNENISMDEYLIKRYTKWTLEELRSLHQAVIKHGKDWNYISFNSGRTPKVLARKWSLISNNKIDIWKEDKIEKKKPRTYRKWTHSEIEMLENAVKLHGKEWKLISQKYFNNIRTPSVLSNKWAYISRDKTDYYNTWTQVEDQILRENVEKFGSKWSQICQFLENRTPAQVCLRWYYINRSKRGFWTDQENSKLLSLVEKYGHRWTYISEVMGRPTNGIHSHYQFLISKVWSKEEKKKLFEAIQKYGYDWDKIMKIFPDRSLIEIKSVHKWNPSTNPYVNLGSWSEEERNKMKQAFAIHGRKWKNVAKEVGTRTNVQCRYFYDYQVKKSDRIEKLKKKHSKVIKE
ncbi:7081_t:CDS:1 [Diversispora eburnea]|uniref:7081_t:CDS:1 n=1 Tax=Diversispora eburnea TaxID=1213867 RepID=A0A9N8V050_9GLOM|nr:7081_t:CDS:1 [Diversispora eburnea]